MRFVKPATRCSALYVKRQYSVQTSYGGLDWRSALSSVFASVCLSSVGTASSDGGLGSPSIVVSCRETRQSRRRPAATGATGPASVSSVDFAVEIRTVCHTYRFFTSLTVLSIPAPQRVPRRREKRAPAFWSAAASADSPVDRAPR